jgi:UDP-glucose 6-dehydrogenase
VTPSVGIIGLGWVGRAVMKMFPAARVHDPGQGRICPDALDADVVFICVPTPRQIVHGTLDTGLVERIAVQCHHRALVVVRSTVNPGTCARLADIPRRVVYQPEYLGETVAHPLFDETARTFLVLGGTPEDCRALIEVYHGVYNANIRIRQMSLLEAEIVKLSENRAIAWKVMQCQELYDACEAAGVDYYAIREAVYGDDPRFNLWFSFVFPGRRGFDSSKCLVKDVPAWCAWAESLGADAQMTKLLVERSKEYASFGRDPVLQGSAVAQDD